MDGEVDRELEKERRADRQSVYMARGGGGNDLFTIIQTDKGSPQYLQIRDSNDMKRDTRETET